MSVAVFSGWGEHSHGSGKGSGQDNPEVILASGLIFEIVQLFMISAAWFTQSWIPSSKIDSQSLIVADKQSYTISF